MFRKHCFKTNIRPANPILSIPRGTLASTMATFHLLTSDDFLLEISEPALKMSTMLKSALRLKEDPSDNVVSMQLLDSEIAKLVIQYCEEWNRDPSPVSSYKRLSRKEKTFFKNLQAQQVIRLLTAANLLDISRLYKNLCVFMNEQIFKRNNFTDVSYLFVRHSSVRFY
ncbi:hypothetical protein L596_015740 [Steinernema carpocapsae]|uniref:SKP1 component POZ domain-containing protein n=1 Tax=Steinernema carpocapsae TaxID=34508 RepID=A0A4U5NFX9_STECR|nr:hypothetical protein L596_015740 [Steinernema carpocapsae]